MSTSLLSVPRMHPPPLDHSQYAAFNDRDAESVAEFLTDDCVYEDLLLGPYTVCRGKPAFLNALRFHPAFVSSRLLSGLPFADSLPELTLEIDSVAEGIDTVGVEWHVQVGGDSGAAFPLGRGLSQARVCKQTGKIERVVDIAEAPWRTVGLLLLPFISLVNLASNMLAEEDAVSEEEMRRADVWRRETAEERERLAREWQAERQPGTSRDDATLS
jgi:hypothetical protein